MIVPSLHTLSKYSLTHPLSRPTNQRCPSLSMTTLYWFTVALGALVIIWYWICASYYMFQITRKLFKHGSFIHLFFTVFVLYVTV